MELCLPASSANLGPAFDSAAIALQQYLRVKAEAAAEFAVRAGGRDASICSAIENNLVLETYRDVLARAGRTCVPLSLQVENEIPIGKGCGSSAAARLAGVALAVHFGPLPWSDDEILREAIRLEGHADNVGACWLGGFVLAQSGGCPPAVRIPAAKSWPLLLVLSAEKLSTTKSRGMLPSSYDRGIVVANVQSAMALTAAYALGREDLFAMAQRDGLHQPYRSAACPLLPCLQPLAGAAGILSVSLSGAGGSVLLTLQAAASPQQVQEMVRERLHAAQLDAELMLTGMAELGAVDLRSIRVVERV